MRIIESINELEQFKKQLKLSPSFWIPHYADFFKHYVNNSISFIYIYLINEDIDYIIPFHHNDCLNLDYEHITDLTSSNDIYILAKKRFTHFYSDTCYDADMVAWWQTHSMLALDDTNTMAHDIWNRWWFNETNANNWLPITKQYERCAGMKNEFMKHYKTFKLTPEFKSYESMFIDNFYAIERNGLHVNYDQFINSFKTNGLINQKVYTEYNPYTSTGRPSNKFGGVNYAALNKEDGCRKSFTSRHERGMLIEFDFDAYHVRLIADLIDYNLPNGSVHEYFGKQYFGVDNLSQEQYEQSKQITFRLLYGGIDKDFEKIPFFGKTKKYIYKLWSSFKKQGYIKTPYFQRPMYKKYLHETNPNKLFNYLLQATETEHNIHIINSLNGTLSKYNSKLILYTYDSLLFDFDLQDGKELIVKIKEDMSDNGKYPVKIQAGINYHSMNDMTSKLV
tara:strand:+ start:1306 stop:2655 length:1350 start_codon:yes stop_codon:yes gene_type:complete